MVELPFDPDDPPDDPPEGAGQPMLWRVALRLHRDHDLVIRDSAGRAICELCRQPWPCIGRRLARRGLVSAWRDRAAAGNGPSKKQAGYGPSEAEIISGTRTSDR